jgi:hypothetical protein
VSQPDHVDIPISSGHSTLARGTPKGRRAGSVLRRRQQPKNMKLLRLPPYAPELNPQEHVWDELREKEFPNRVYADMASVRAQLEAGLPRLAGDHQALRSLTAWPWIDRLRLNAH